MHANAWPTADKSARLRVQNRKTALVLLTIAIAFFVGIIATKFMGGVYYWLPKWSGRMYSMTLAKWHFWLSAISVNVLFFPQHFLGLAGMPRRIPDYSTQFADWNMVSSLGGFAFGLSQLLFPLIIWQCVRGGAKAADRAWDGAHGLEWELRSPAPRHSWQDAPSPALIASGTRH